MLVDINSIIRLIENDLNNAILLRDQYFAKQVVKLGNDAAARVRGIEVALESLRLVRDGTIQL